jgi:hypothetical protein
MERFGILEMELVADIYREEQKTDWKFDAFHTVLDNNFNRVPHGWTVVYLRSTPVQIVPDCLLDNVKELSMNGFAHDPEESCLVCLYDARSEEGMVVFRLIMELVVDWLDANL